MWNSRGVIWYIVVLLRRFVVCHNKNTATIFIRPYMFRLQVKGFGCEAFALLFDDIDDELQNEDQDAFDSPADAQCTITNLVYEDLGQPNVFLFCPTGLRTKRQYLLYTLTLNFK